MSNPTRTEEDITTGLLAVIAWAGNYTAAARALKAEGKLNVTSGTLRDWALTRYPDRFAELRDKYTEQLEAQLVHEYRDVARHAVDVMRLGLEKAHIRLKQNEDNDPARTAAHAGRTAQVMTDKMLSLSGRPTQIRQDVNLEATLRSLAAKGVIQLPEEYVQEEEPLPELPERTKDGENDGERLG